MDCIDQVDVTDRAVAGGWTLPKGWAVVADTTHDGTVTDLMAEFGKDSAYDHPEIVASWLRDDWYFVVVSVYVRDDQGREWGHALLGGVEAGSFPWFDAEGNVSWLSTINPLTDPHPIADQDMIGQALRDAVVALAAFGTPVIVEPAGTHYSGL